MLEALYGKWKLIESQNFDKYLATYDVPEAVQKAGEETNIHIVISKVGDKVRVETVMPWGFSEIEARLGEEFRENTLDNRRVIGCLTDQDNKLVHVQQWQGHHSKIVREIKNDKMVTTFSHRGVKAVRIFERE